MPIYLAFWISLHPCIHAYLPHSPEIRKVYRFPNGTWVENIAVRPNGNLLVSLLSTAELWEIHISPSTRSGENPVSLIHHFDDAKDVDGITELAPDIYTVIASNSVWTVDSRNHRMKPNLTLVAKLPAGFLDGMAALDKGRTVAITDSQLGLVWRLDVRTGEFDVIHQHKTMAANEDLGLLLGINGLKIWNNYMYYSNSPKRIFCRVRIDIRTGRALGRYRVVGHDVLADDFAIGPSGVGYLAGLVDDVVTRVFPNGHREVVAGSKGSRVLMTATMAAFGRTQNDSNVLYVTTGGETDHPVQSAKTRGGKVMAVPVGF